MLTLYHAPKSRSSRIVALIEELGIRDRVTVEIVDLKRMDGSGAVDPRNPHPDGKVPLLDHDGVLVWESTAIALHLADMFSEAGLALPVGHPDRGRMLSWLAWYGDVLEPLIVFAFGEIDHPLLQLTFRGLPEAHARLIEAFADGRSWLAGDRFTIADLIVASTFQWAPALAPSDSAVQAWIARCASRPSVRLVEEDDAACLKAA